MAVILHSNDQEVAPNLILNRSFPDQVNARNVIMNNLQNDQSSYLNHLKIIAKISKAGSKKVLYEFVKEDSMQVAPNSNFNFPVPLNGDKLEAGKYDVDLVAYGEEDPNGKYDSGLDKDGNKQLYKYKWALSSTFDISKEEAKTLNEKDVTVKRDDTLWYVVGGFICIILALLLIIVLMKKKQKQSADNE